MSALYLHLTCTFTLNNLYLYLYLYLLKNLHKPSKYTASSDLAWQRNYQIRPLNNVAGRISAAPMLRPGWMSRELRKMEAQVQSGQAGGALGPTGTELSYGIQVAYCFVKAIAI